jgi:beta-lactamase superfamily II metal-dependent hydrolase
VNKLELMVFNVGHGLSVALIERPDNYVTLVDLGADTGFTPLKHLSTKLKLKPDIVCITHPHADHLEDVETALDKNFRPLGLHYQAYDWADVKTREKKDCAYKVDQFVELQQVVPFRNYGGRATLDSWAYTPENAKKYFGDTTYVNNSSLFVVYKWRDFKIAIAGDLESDGMTGMVRTKGFQDVAKGTYILIPSHHGHTNGFPTEWVTKMGKPFVSIVSIQSRDENVDSRYWSTDFATGVTFDGKTRRELTTRSDGSILVTMWYDANDQATWSFTAF